MTSRTLSFLANFMNKIHHSFITASIITNHRYLTHQFLFPNYSNQSTTQSITDYACNGDNNRINKDLRIHLHLKLICTLFPEFTFHKLRSKIFIHIRKITYWNACNCVIVHRFIDISSRIKMQFFLT